MRSGRVKKRRTQSPDKSKRPRVLRRQEKALGRVAQAILRTILRIKGRILRYVLDIEKVVLRNEWENGAHDEIPIFGDGNGNYRLDVAQRPTSNVQRSMEKKRRTEAADG